MGGKHEKEKVQKERLLNKPAKTGITVRQRKLIKGLVVGKSNAQAAREAGYAQSTVRSVDKILKKPAVQALLREAIEKAGITVELISQRLREGMDAQETKFFQKDGLVTDSRDVIAYGERRASTELVTRLLGMMVEKHEHDIGPTLAELLEESYQK